jgi:hypothetical protein
MSQLAWSLQHILNSVHDIGQILLELVLPNSKNDPSLGLQRRSDSLISLEIASDLPGPVLQVRSRHATVQGATVPKATINEDR